MIARKDLLYLSPEALSQATNAGIVKRALRELAGGYKPTLTLDNDSTLTAVFDDGITCKWPVDISIDTASCTCASAKTCRHRIITALAYRSSNTNEAGATDGNPDSTEHTADPVASVLAETLEAFVSTSVLTQAKRHRKSGVTIGLHLKGKGEPCDTARLPSATVRFWGGASLPSARCDCTRQTACEHIVLATWAFQSLSHADHATLEHKVFLGDQKSKSVFDNTAYYSLVNTMMYFGVARSDDALAQSLSNAQSHSNQLRAAWLDSLLADIENWSGAYTRRSNLYDATTGCTLLAELGLRLAAGQKPDRVQDALGIGLSGETALDSVRLNALGSRIRRDGTFRTASVIMADVDTGTPMVVNCSWEVPSDTTQKEIQLRDQARIAPGVQLGSLVHGQLLTKKAHRSPTGNLRLAGARRNQNNLLPQLADWSCFNQPVRYESVAELKTALQVRPIAFIEPRHAARRFVIFSPNKLEALAYDPARQSVHMLVYDKQDQIISIEREHEDHVPNALDAIAQVASGQHGTIHHIAGMLSWNRGIAHLEPWSFSCDNGFIVPDFSQHKTGALAQLELASAPVLTETHDLVLLSELGDLMATLLHNGIGQLPRNWHSDVKLLVQSLSNTGFTLLSENLNGVLQQILNTSQQPNTKPELNDAKDMLMLLALWQLHLDVISSTEATTNTVA